jgi:hypothetical protein
MRFPLPQTGKIRRVGGKKRHVGWQEEEEEEEEEEGEKMTRGGTQGCMYSPAPF